MMASAEGKVADGTTFTSIFRPGQVLFGKRRAYQRKVAVADFRGVCSGDIYVLEPANENLLPELLPFLCQTDRFFEHAVGTSAGSLSPRTNWRQLSEYEFALPPLDEQRRLVGALRASTRTEYALCDLQVSLGLLLSSTIDECADHAATAGSTLALEELVEGDRPITYGILKPGKEVSGGVPVVKVRDFPNGEIITDNLLQIDPSIAAEYARSTLRSGDLLISIRGTVGRLAFVPEKLDGANITQDTARLSLRSDINSEYIRAMIESSFVQRQIASLITGLAVQGINLGELRRVRLPMIGRAQQDELIREVAAIRDSTSKLEVRVAASRAIQKSLLHRALEDDE